MALCPSGRRAGADRGQLDDPDRKAADDASDLAYRLARGEGKLFRLSLYLTVDAGSEEDLAAETQAVRALAASLLLVTVPATFRLPAGTDQLMLRRTMDTAALAASFPFTSPDLPRDPRRAQRAARRPVRGQHRRAGAGGLGPLSGRQPQLRHLRRVRGREVVPGEAGDPPVPVPGHRVLGNRPRGRVRATRRGGRRRVHPPRRAGRAPQAPSSASGGSSPSLATSASPCGVRPRSLRENL